MPNHGAEHIAEIAAHLLTGIAVAVPDASACYLSTPITGGPHLVRVHDSGDLPALGTSAYTDLLREQVVAPNTNEAGDLTAELRKRLGTPVIDPAVVPYLRGWSQDDYLRFWLGVIDRFCTRMVMRDGWHLSAGCVAEYAHAVTRGLDVSDQDLEPLDPTRAVHLVEEASDTLRALSLPTVAHDELLDHRATMTELAHAEG